MKNLTINLLYLFIVSIVAHEFAIAVIGTDTSFIVTLYILIFCFGMVVTSVVIDWIKSVISYLENES